MKKKVLLLINGSAGKMLMEKSLYKIVETLSKGGYEVTVYPIIPNEGLMSEEIIGTSDTDYDMVVCGGGDGTLNHVINGLMLLPPEKRPLLGYIPAGSTNDFAKSVNIPADDIELSCETLVNGSPFSYDIGCFNGRYFNYIAAFGAFSEISYSTDQNFKNALGHAAYILNGLINLQENIGYKCHMRINVDGTCYEDDYVFGAIYSATSVGGFNLQSGIGGHKFPVDVKFDDGMFEMLLIKAPEKLGDLNKITQALMSRDFSSPYISFTQVKSVKIHSAENASWTLDGEYGGTFDEINVTVCHKAVSIMVQR